MYTVYNIAKGDSVNDQACNTYSCNRLEMPIDMQGALGKIWDTRAMLV